MKRINRTLRLLAVTAVAVGTLLPTAPVQAVTVSVSPVSQTIGVASPASVNIVVSGLTQALGGFQFVLTFNNTILASVGQTPNPDNKMGALPLDLSGVFVAGSPFDVFYVADAGAVEADLAAAQGAGFTLATVGFTGANPGLSALTLSGVELSNFTGGATIPGVVVENGEICVTAPGAADCPRDVPEPGTLVLLTLGMLGIGLTRRRRSS
jgi:hypothetical protein